MKNPFDMSEVETSLEEQEQQPRVDTHNYQTDDGNRSLLQDEARRPDDLKNRFIGAIDQGTTSSRFIIFDCTGVPVAKYQVEFHQIHENPG